MSFAPFETQVLSPCCPPAFREACSFPTGNVQTSYFFLLLQAWTDSLSPTHMINYSYPERALRLFDTHTQAP